jgi:MATE family multidrug resistance protein
MVVAPTTVRGEIGRLVALGGPAALTQLGWMAIGVVDALMLGRVGVHELDAASLGNLWLWGTTILGMGLVFGMDPIVARAHGAGDPRRIAHALQQGVVLALAVSVPLGLSWFWAEEVLLALGQSAALARDAETYVLIQLPGLPTFLVFCALRQYLQGRGIVAPALWITLIANLVNVAGNWALIWGHLGLPALGLSGAALASTVTRVFLLVGLVVWVRRFALHEHAWMPWTRAAIEPAGLREISAYGVPVALQYGLETWAFQAVSVMAGWLGEVPLASHTIVLNMASLTFMVPLGISIGAATRVGNLLGAGHRAAARRSAFLALALGAGVMSVAALAFVTLRHELPAFYSDDAAVVAGAAAILPIAAAFQLFDGTQVVGGGLLRGMGRPRPAVVFNLLGYYLLGLPLAGLLAFGLDLGLPGLWWALCVALGTVAACLVVWIRRRS